MASKVTNTMNKIMGYIAVWVEMSNPNGNIEDGSPRCRSDGIGWISSMCSKRQFRELLADHDSPVFREILADCGIPEERLHIFESKEKGFDGLAPKDAIKAALTLSDEEKLAKYIDMRWFGTTCLEERSDKTKTGESVRFLRTGCIHIDPLCSLAPIDIVVAGVSKKASLRDVEQDLGPEAIKIVTSGLYVGSFFISAAEAFKTKATEKDVELFLSLVRHMFSSKKSAQRTNVQVVSAMAATHDGALGSFPEHLFANACRPRILKDIPLTLDDYHIPTLSEVKRATGKLDIVKIVDLLE